MKLIKTLKEDVKTLDQAKSKAKAFFWIACIPGLVIAVVFMFLSIILGILFAIASFGLAGFLYFTELQKAKRNFCPECGAKYNYETDIAWEITEENIVDVKPNPNASGKQICGKRKDTYRFECTCSSCGHVREFNTTFQTGVAYTDGSVKLDNRETIAKNYFRV